MVIHIMSTELFKDANDILQSSCSAEDALHIFHTQYEKRVFDYLKAKYMRQLDGWWKNYSLPLISETDRCIVLYETRCHSNLEFLIYNLTYFAQGWGLIIYCSVANYEFITRILDHNRFKAMLHVVRNDEGGREVRDEYNAFVKSSVFWNSLPCKYVLMCEMDAYLRKPVPDSVIEYDYACCSWPWYKDLPGGGGISIRTVRGMRRICNELPDLSEKHFAQDCWAAEGSVKLGLRWNNTYFVEAAHNIIDPVGFHNWWTFIDARSACTDRYDKYLTLEL